jgi:hypothetical protein
MSNHGLTLACWASVFCSSAIPWACILPPPISEIQEAPNSAPRLIPETLIPAPTTGPQAFHPTCLRDAIFEVAVEDLDGDALYWRIFVDYFSAQAEKSPTIHEEDGALDATIQLSIALHESQFESSTNPHTVEVFVADLPFKQGSVALAGRTLDDTSPSQGSGHYDTFVWTVIVDEELPECEQSP